MLLRSASCLGVAVFATVSVFAQAGGKPSGSAPISSGPGSISNTAGRSTSPFPGATSPNNTPTRPVFLSGQVMMDDGTPPPESVPVQRVCSSNPHTETYTDNKGHFSFEVGQHVGVIPDATEDSFGRPPGMSNSASSSGTPGSGGANDVNRLLMGCLLRASLPGYRSDTLNLTNHKSLDDPEVGTIILHRIANVEGATISATSAFAPKDAKKSFEKAEADLRKNKWEDAEKELTKATGIYPKYAAAWYQLGRVQEYNKNTDAAKNSFTQAIAADSKYVNPYCGLATIAAREAKWQEVKDTTDRLLKLDPANFPDMWFYNALANYRLKNYDLAEKSARAGIKVDTDHAQPRTNQLLAALLADRKDYAGAAQSLKDYLQVAPNGPEAETVRKQLANVEQKLQATAPVQKSERN
ncbi:MAG: tetratricopeptide repeat protein [Bryobacteraceae bacterium]